MKRVLKWSPIILLSLLAIFVLYKGLVFTQKKEIPQRIKRGEIPIQISAVTFKPITHYVSLVGDIMPLMQVDLYPRISGYIETINVRLGDPVRKGHIIARIENTDYLQKIREAEAKVLQARAQLLEIEKGTRIEELRQAEEAVRQAESRYNNAKIQKERIEALYKRGVISKKEFDLSEMEYTISEAQLESAREHLKLLREGARKEVRELARAKLKEAEAILDQEKLKFEYTKIRAPFTGEVARRYVDEGSLVSPSTPIVNIVHTESLKIIANILEKDIPYLKLGMKANIRVEAFPDKVFEGKIMNINSVLDLNTRTLQAEIHIPNKDHMLKPGMFARIDILLLENPKALVILKDALIEEGKEKYVFVLKGNKVAKRAISTGFEQGQFIEIKEGLSEGDQVVVRGKELLREDSIVRIIEGD